jgi:hypothetical protein
MKILNFFEIFEILKFFENFEFFFKFGCYFPVRQSLARELTDSNKNSKSSLLLAFSIIKNILPLVEGVMVDDHTLEKEYHPRRSRG